MFPPGENKAPPTFIPPAIYGPSFACHRYSRRDISPCFRRERDLRFISRRLVTHFVGGVGEFVDEFVDEFVGEVVDEFVAEIVDEFVDEFVDE